MDLAKMLRQREGTTFSDLASLVTDRNRVGKEMAPDRWKILPYRTAERTGTALSAIEEMQPEPVTVDLNISGWYALFVGIESIGTKVDVKLTGDRAFRRAGNTSSFWHWRRYVEEDFFRIAELKDGKVTFSKTREGNATVYWIRAVPLREEEVWAYQRDCADPRNRRLNVTEDFCDALARYDQSDGEEPWLYIVEQYRDADVESMSLEYFTDRLPETSYVAEPVSRAVQQGLRSGLGARIQKKLIAYGQELGWNMYLSQRISYGEFESPMQSANAFFPRFGTRREFCCVDRDGRKMNFLSFAYEKVQEERISELVGCVETGCDGVELICNRCPSLILFEEPFAERFHKEYGFRPNGLPISDDRIFRVKSEMVTEFFRALRRALEAECRRLNRKSIRIGIKVPYSVYDCRLLGLDLETLAKEGLIDRVVSYPVIMRERLDGDIWTDDQKTEIDLEKYTRYADQSEERIIDRRDYSGPGEPMFVPPIADHTGTLRGPATLKERVEEFLKLEQYGIEVGIDVLPRTIPPKEILEKFRELTDLGVKHFSLWDTYARVVRLSEWSITSRMGHADELHDFSDGEGILYRNERILELDGVDISRYMPNWIG